MDFNTRKLITDVFNNGGYILDFNDYHWKIFTIDSVGIDLKEKYNVSKGKSLTEFLADNQYSDDLKYKLTNDLIAYYEENKDKNEYIDLDRLNELKQLISNHTSIIKSDNFTNTDYVKKQISMLNYALKEQSAYECIGLAKENVETCCKDILKSYAVPPNHQFVPLLEQTLKVLGISRKEETIKNIIDGLVKTLQSLSKLRNENGSGHGRESNHCDIEMRYAKLAINVATTIIYFFNDTYKVNNK